MRYSYIFILIIIVVISLLIYRNKELFEQNEYDYTYKGDLVIKDGNIGIGKEPEKDKMLIVDGTLHVEDNLCLGETCFDYDTVKKLNELPVFKKDELCLKDGEDKICITEDHLKIITGEKNIIFKNNYEGGLQPVHFSRHGGHGAGQEDLTHDDEGDASPMGGIKSVNYGYHGDILVSSINPLENQNKDPAGNLMTGDSKEYSIMPEPIDTSEEDKVLWDTITKANKNINWIYAKNETEDETGYLWISDTNGDFYRCKKICKSEADFEILSQPPDEKIDIMAIFDYKDPEESASAIGSKELNQYIYTITKSNKHYIIKVDDLDSDENLWKEVITDKKFAKLTGIGEHLYGLTDLTEGSIFKMNTDIKFKKVNKYRYWGQDSYENKNNPRLVNPWSPSNRDSKTHKSEFTFKKFISHKDKIYIICDLNGYYPITWHDKMVYGSIPKLYGNAMKLSNLVFVFDRNDIQQDMERKDYKTTFKNFKWLPFPSDPPPDGFYHKNSDITPHIQVLDMYIGTEYVYVIDIYNNMYQQPVNEFTKYGFLNMKQVGATQIFEKFTKTKEEEKERKLLKKFSNNYNIISITEHNRRLWLLNENFKLYQYDDLNLHNLNILKESTNDTLSLIFQKDVEFKNLYVDFCNNLVGIDIYNKYNVLGDFKECPPSSTTTSALPTTWKPNDEVIGMILYTKKDKIKYGIINDKLIRTIGDAGDAGTVIDSGIKFIAPLDKDIEDPKYLWCIKKDNKLYQYSLKDDLENKITWDATVHTKSKDISIDTENNVWSISADSNIKDEDNDWTNLFAYHSINKNDKHIPINRWAPETVINDKDPEDDLPDYWNNRILANGEYSIFRVDNKNKIFKCKKPCDYNKWTEVEIEQAKNDKFQSDKNSLYYIEDNQIKYKNMLNVLDNFNYKCFQGPSE